MTSWAVAGGVQPH